MLFLLRILAPRELLEKSYKMFSEEFILIKLQARKFIKAKFPTTSLSSMQTSHQAIHLSNRQNNYQNVLH